MSNISYMRDVYQGMRQVANFKEGLELVRENC